jgi:predicted TIM-barrel fold metal-dependent hydrolase
MQTLRIVDAHMHLWDLGRIAYPWLTPPLPVGINGDVSPIAKNYLLDDYFRDTTAGGGAAPAKIVHVEAGASPRDSLAETRWLQGLAHERGFPQAIVAHAELNQPDVEYLLAAHAAHANVRGIRQIINWHPDPVKTFTPRDLLGDADWLKGFALLRKYGLSFDLQIYPTQMLAAAALAARHPDTSIILNHAGMPLERDGAGINAWRTGMRALAGQPNVSVKISGLAMLDWRWTPQSLRPFVLETLEIFGVERCLFASNFPVDRLYGSFASFYDAYESIIGACSLDEKHRLFAGNAERIYRL